MLVRIEIAGRLNVAVEPCASGSLPGCPSVHQRPMDPDPRQQCGPTGGAESPAESLGGHDNGLSVDRAPFRTGIGEGQLAVGRSELDVGTGMVAQEPGAN
jgi:hypothetical protein